MISHRLTVDKEHGPERLDVFITRMLPDLPSRTFIHRLIEQGQVTVNTQTVKSRAKLNPGDVIEVLLEENNSEEIPLKPEAIPVNIFYEDENLAVINKPSGLSVHPAAGQKSGTLANALCYHFQNLSDANGPVRPGIVHRLDRDTSGLMVIAKNNVAHARLARQFEKHKVYKRYVALIHGRVEFDQGAIDAPIGDHATYYDRKQVSFDERARPALTYYEVLDRFSHSSMIALYPQTGRTHQLRVHLKYLGHPILGDTYYGKVDAFPRLALHAQGLGFLHPITKHYVEFSSLLPQEFQKNP